MVSAADAYDNDYLRYLYRRAKQGVTTMDLGVPIEEENLSTEEVERLLRYLERTKDQLTQSMILDILRYAGASLYDSSPSIFGALRESIARFLIGPNPSLASKALSILCDDWVLTSEYTEQLYSFVRGVAWDDRSHCRTQALQIAIEHLSRPGDHLLSKDKLRLLQAILEVYEKEESAALRESAYNALLHIFGWRGSQDVILSAKNMLGINAP